MRFTTSFCLFLIIIATLAFPEVAACQQKLFAVGRLEEGGRNYGYQFQQGGNVLEHGWLSPYGNKTTGIAFTFNEGLFYRFTTKWAVEGGFQLTEINMIVRDVKFQQNLAATEYIPHGGNTVYGAEGNFYLAHTYGAPYAALYYFPGGKQFFVGAGALYNYKLRHLSDSWTSRFQDGQALQLNAHFAGRYPSGYVETGFLIPAVRREEPATGRVVTTLQYFLSVRYYLAGQVMNGEYQDTKSGSLLYSDKFAASGRYFSLTIGVAISLPAISISLPAISVIHKHKNRKEKPIKYREPAHKRPHPTAGKARQFTGIL